MRIAALICGLIAGLFALVAPVALGIDLVSPFLTSWGASPSQQLLGTVAWYAPVVAAVLGGLLAFVAPGPGALLLLLAGLGWVGFGVFDPNLMRPELLGPGFVSLVGSVLAFLAGELELMRRRAARRARRESMLGLGVAEQRPDSDLPPDIPVLPRDKAVRSREAAKRREEAQAREDALALEEERAREAALNMDPRTVMRGEAPPPPKNEIPLTLEDVVPTEVLERSQRPEDPIWTSSSTPRRSVFDRPDELDLQPRKSLFDRPAERVERRASVNDEDRELRADDRYRASNYRDEPRQRRSGFLWIATANIVVLALIAVGVAYLFFERSPTTGANTVAEAPAAEPTKVPDAVPAAPATAEDDRLEANVLPALAQPDAQPPALPTLPMSPATPTDAAVTKTGAQTFDNPFDYCRAVGTIDYVDSRYTGPHLTVEIANALRVPLDSAPDRVSWRCFEGTTLACASFDWPVCAMTPSAKEMIEYCLRNPDVTRLLAPNGTWSCDGSKPKLPEGASWPVDARGFFPSGWIPVLPSQTPSG